MEENKEQDNQDSVSENNAQEISDLNSSEKNIPVKKSGIPKDNVPNASSSGNEPDLLGKMRENPWVVSTIVLGLIVMIFLVTSLSNITGNTITGRATGIEVVSGNYAGNAVLEIAKASLGEDISILRIEEKSGLYEVVLSFEGQELPIYVTLDGENLVQGLTPLSLLQEQAQQAQNPPQTSEPDWTIFENSLPEDLKAQILNFEFEEPSQTGNQRVLEFDSYIECENTLIVFHQPGCGWCTEYYPVLMQAKEDYPELNVYSLILSEERDIAQIYNVRGTPASVINCNYLASGYMDKETLYNILDEFN